MGVIQLTHNEQQLDVYDTIPMENYFEKIINENTSIKEENKRILEQNRIILEKIRKLNLERMEDKCLIYFTECVKKLGINPRNNLIINELCINRHKFCHRIKKSYVKQIIENLDNFECFSNQEIIEMKNVFLEYLARF